MPYSETAYAKIKLALHVRRRRLIEFFGHVKTCEIPRSLAALSLMLAGCAGPPDSICDMPSNYQFWQGVRVRWTGDVVQLMTRAHFMDPTCFDSIEIDFHDRDRIRRQFDWSKGELKVATFTVEGKLRYDDGEIVLTPTKMTRTSAWKIPGPGETFEEFMKRSYPSL